MEKQAKIYVAGHKGLIGSAFVRCLVNEGYENLILVDRSAVDLTDAKAVELFFDQQKPDYVVLAAGKVGGIIENQTYPADFISTNLAIQLNVLRAAHRTNVRKLILFGSSCMYPRECTQPMSEAALLTGKPEPTSLAYAVAKLAGVQTCLAYNQQFSCKRFIPVIPNSVYGPNDNFDPASSHVLSALIRRFHEAKLAKADTVTLWGSGSPRREFIHADDVAGACFHLLTQEITEVELPLNLGSGKDHSIKELAESIATVVGYTGRIAWDTEKPDGSPRKLLDSSRIRALGWKPKVDFIAGLRETYAWYQDNCQAC